MTSQSDELNDGPPAGGLFSRKRQRQQILFLRNGNKFLSGDSSSFLLDAPLCWLTASVGVTPCRGQRAGRREQAFVRVLTEAVHADPEVGELRVYARRTGVGRVNVHPHGNPSSVPRPPSYCFCVEQELIKINLLASSVCVRVPPTSQLVLYVIVLLRSKPKSTC